MLDYLSQLFINKNDSKINEVFTKLQAFYPDGEDPWGLNLEKAKKSLKYIYPLYKDYFKVRVFGLENAKDEPYIIISNHSGQIAIDGMLISTAFAMEMETPRILRPMVERFFTNLPFVATWAAEGGAVLGDRQNCMTLLEKGQTVLAFPEGVHGVAKSTSEFYQLQRFTRGFLRMALLTGTKILPVSVVGAEETFPFVYQARGVAKALGLPAFPISANYFPLPSPIDIHIGKPFTLPSDLDPEVPNELIDPHIRNIQKYIQDMTTKGLTMRRPFFASKKL